MRSEQVHYALDGGVATFSSGVIELFGSVTSMTYVMTDGQRQLVVGAPRRHGEEFLGNMMSYVSAGLTDGAPDEFSLKGGTLRASLVRLTDNAGPIDRLSTVWLGRSSALEAEWPPTTSVYQALDALTGFSLAERGEHAVLTPIRPGTAHENHAHVVKHIPRIGVLEVVPRASGRAVPEWLGTPVNGGELFVSSPGELRMHYVLVNDDMIATLSSHTPTSDEEILSVLEDLTVSFVPRA